jgi:hypothetical protein
MKPDGKSEWLDNHMRAHDRTPRRTRLRNLTVLSLFALIPAGISQAGAGGAPINQTKVTLFQPAIPISPSRTGDCWTDSIAVARSGGWRCTVGNEIYDPCFSRPGLSRAVICDANPAKGSAGFVLNLTKPLPKPSSQCPAYPRPWLVKLADGTECEIQTGTIAQVDGIAVPYGCSDSRQCNDSGCPYMTGLAEKFKRGKVWTADKIAYSSSDKGLKLISRKPVAVEAVWK